LRDVIPTARRARPDPLVSVAPAQAAAAASSRWWCRPATMAGSQGVLVTITVLSAALVHVLLALVVAVVLVVVAVTLLVFPGNSPHPRRIPAASSAGSAATPGRAGVTGCCTPNTVSNGSGRNESARGALFVLPGACPWASPRRVGSTRHP